VRQFEYEDKCTVHVRAPGSLDALVSPTVGSRVTCKILRINARNATVAILCVDEQPLKQAFSGVIRLQDITSSAELGKLQMQQCYRPGDVVLARVLSLGDRRNFYLTTAATELGVIFAKSEDAGAPLVPISWNAMQCSETGAVETRKVAKLVAVEDDEQADDEQGDK
jgi:exosome complex component CSL4